ncbi:RidA family protein [Psychroflexus tropicus]|uniref:RidA family protein n=1 Tax=Psychroflexus tropicus TaxID=197345 RepID=UPI00036B2C97|nr:RidA family protein [Psychroflexus tropicus]
MKKIIKTNKAAAPIGPYNQAIIVNGFLYTSGQIALEAKSGELLQGSIEDETSMVMKNIKAILDEAGYEFSDVIKTSIFISDMSNFSIINSVYGSYFDHETAPARETVQVARLPKDANVEISLIAYKA